MIREKINAIIEEHAMNDNAIIDYYALSLITDYLENNHIEYESECTDWGNMEGGVFSLSFIEDNQPNLIVIEYFK